MEISVEEYVCTEAELHGWLVRKLAWIGRRGGPDRFFLKNGRIVLIEFKSPRKSNDGLEGTQSKEVQRLIEHGAEVYVTSNPRVALRHLGIRK